MQQIASDLTSAGSVAYFRVEMAAQGLGRCDMSEDDDEHDGR
jgi:hypothetical protein